MRRKRTELEENLCFLGYKLDHKTYFGKRSDKVGNYVYIQNINGDTFYVNLNRERTKIESFSFTTRRYERYNAYSIEDIQETYNTFENQLKGIYDFEKQEVKTIDTINLEDMVEPIVEESVFDD